MFPRAEWDAGAAKPWKQGRQRRGSARPRCRGPRHRPAPVRGLAAPSKGPRGSSALPLGRAPDPDLRQSEHPHLRFFFRTFPPAEARRLAQRVQLVFTPRHVRWLNMAEPELSVLTRQALAPAHGHAGRGLCAGHRVGGDPQRGPKWHPLAVPHRRRPRASQTSEFIKHKGIGMRLKKALRVLVWADCYSSPPNICW